MTKIFAIILTNIFAVKYNCHFDGVLVRLYYESMNGLKWLLSEVEKKYGSQREFAKHIIHSRGTVNNHISGKVKITLEAVFDYAEGLDINPLEILLRFDKIKDLETRDLILAYIGLDETERKELVNFAKYLSSKQEP